MNKVILMGRLTRDPDISYKDGNPPMAIARYTLAVDRRGRNDSEQTADFINCVAFGKAGEHVEKYYRKGLKVVVEGRLQSNSYKNKDGQTVYTTNVVVESQEFAESKSNSNSNSNSNNDSFVPNNEEFMTIPDGLESELPFV